MVKILKYIFSVRSLFVFAILCFIAEAIYQLVTTHDTAWHFTHPIQPVAISITCIAALIAPFIIMRKCKIEIPTILLSAYAILLYCTKFLGTLRGVYYIIFWWDILMHFVICAGLALFGFTLSNLLRDTHELSLSPLLVSIFAFCFSTTLGVVWEIFEFALDSILNTTTQQFVSPTGEPLVGQAALANTMIDIIANMVGAAIASAYGYFSLKRQKGWLDRFYVKRIEAK